MRRVLPAVASALALIASLLVASPAGAQPGIAEGGAAATQTVVKTADLSTFSAGNIVSDAVFFDSGTMTEAQIQAFLEEKVPNCQSGYTCLKDWYDTSRTTQADAMCGAYSGGTRERASRIIYKVARACGINPQVILVTLQKEQGLVTHVWPSDWRYTIAMGQGCPDTSACDERYYGFFNQVYGAAWQFKRYANPPGTSQYFTWYAPGNTWSILYNPDRSCGSSPVAVQNQATANLYYYTPYQPNSAALRAGYGEGDGCSAYGNRNFFNYFTDWFGSTQQPVDPCRLPSSGQITAASGEYVTTPAGLNARTAPSTNCSDGLTLLEQGTVVVRTGVYGDWWRVEIDRRTRWVHSDYLEAAPPVAYDVARIAGESRYDTAVAVSQAAYPDGTDTVFIASGVDYPDALTAGAAAGHIGASLLLTEPDALRPAAVEELARLAPAHVVLVGGNGRISAALAARIGDLVPDADVSRVAGVDRYETGRMIAEAYFAGAEDAYVATGRNYPDAVVAAALGGALGRPVLLVNGTASTADAATLATIERLGVKRTSIAGSASTVSSGIEDDLDRAGATPTRFGGIDRYATGRLMVAAAYPAGAPQAFVATGQLFPDALTGSVLAARSDAPLLTTPTACMAWSTKDWLIGAGTGQVTLIGGLPSLSAAVADSTRC